MSAEKWLATLLRINAVILMLAFAAVLLPTSWMADIHRWLGLGELPETPLIGYLTRSVSGLYGLLGIATWILAGDVHRYWPLVTFWSVSSIVFGPVVLIIDAFVNLPTFWVAFEGPYLFVLGVILLVLQIKVRRQQAAH